MTEEAPAVAEGQAVEAPEAAEGQAAPNWYDGASDETIGFLQNKGWAEDPLKAIDAYQNLEKFQGVPAEQLLKLPKDMSAEGAMDDIYNRLGRPESADKYEINIPEGIPVDENRLSVAREAAHKFGLNSTQLQGLLEMDTAYQSKLIEDHKRAVEQQQEIEVNNLKQEWGNNYEERAELGRRFIRDNLPAGSDKEQLISSIEGAIGTAATLKLFANAGDKASRESPVHDSGDSRPFGYTREQAAHDKAQLMSEISGDKERLDNYNKGIGPDLLKMNKLNQIIVG